MPAITSVSDLKASPIYAALHLDQMSTGRLQRFVQVFRRVYDRATRGGAPDGEASARATPFALSAAKAYSAVPAGRQLEAATANFATMATDMAHSASIDGEHDTGLIHPSIEEADAVLAGNTFNYHHNRTDPVGVIRRVIANDGTADPDVPYIIQGSYFADVPQEERHPTVSAEWYAFKTAAGPLAISTSFAIVPSPANDAVLGIKQLTTAGNAFQGHIEYPEASIMPEAPEQSPEQAEMAARVASLTTSLEEVNGAWEKDRATLQRLASVFAPESTGGEFDAESFAAATAKRFAAADRQIAELTAFAESQRVAAVEAEATLFTSELVADGRIASDEVTAWVTDYKENPDFVKRIASRLKPQYLGVHAGTAHATLPDLREAKKEELLAEMEAVF